MTAKIHWHWCIKGHWTHCWAWKDCCYCWVCRAPVDFSHPPPSVYDFKAIHNKPQDHYLAEDL